MVQVGLLLSDVPKSVSPAQQFKDVLRIVDAAQENGFTYIAIGQHFLYGELRWLQPVPLLARLAAHVEPNVKLVTQIMIAPLYHPVMLAEEIATLDVVTEGRLIFGAGLGYRPEEFDYLGIPFKQRAGRFDESLQIMKKLWTEEEVTFHGKYFQLEGVKPHLFPVQDPHPPIWIGAHAMGGVRRAGKYGDAYATPPETPKRKCSNASGSSVISSPNAARNSVPSRCAATCSSPTPASRRCRNTPGWRRAVTSPTRTRASTS